jgi:ketosteroid isomerase-like protein
VLFRIKRKVEDVKKTICVALVAAISLYAMCFAANSGAASPGEKEIKAFLNRQLEAFAKKELQALMGMLAENPDVVMIGNGPNDGWVGRDKIRQIYERQMASSRSEALKLTWTSIGAKGDIGWFSAALVIEAKEAAGKEKLEINWSGVVQKRKGTWVQVQSHFSLPVRKAK